MLAGLSEVTSFPAFMRRRGVAQPGRVLRSGRRSRRFESSRPDQLCISFGVNRSV